MTTIDQEGKEHAIVGNIVIIIINRDSIIVVMGSSAVKTAIVSELYATSMLNKS